MSDTYTGELVCDVCGAEHSAENVVTIVNEQMVCEKCLGAHREGF